MHDRLPTAAERFQRVVARALPDNDGGPIAAPAPPASRSRVRRPPTTPRPPDLVMPESVVLTWPELFAWGLKIRLEREKTKKKPRSRSVVEREHRVAAKVAGPIVRSLPNSGRHARRKAAELIARIWSTLPRARAARDAMILGARQLDEVVRDYAPEAVDVSEQGAVQILMAALNDPAVKSLEPSARRPGYVAQGLRKFREDTVRHAEGGFPDDATAECVAAACGVERVGPKRRRT